jgi:hypothetical protein
MTGCALDKAPHNNTPRRARTEIQLMCIPVYSRRRDKCVNRDTVKLEAMEWQPSALTPQHDQHKGSWITQVKITNENDKKRLDPWKGVRVKLM